MATERTCPRCGTPLSSEALEGLCPKCVGRAAFEREPVDLLPAGESGGEHTEPDLTVINPESARFNPEGAGERIGRYKLLQQIGEGGFGTVWMAEQMEPVSRRVALKIIKPGMDSREVIARFEQERQALAMMDHPNIAKVHDTGATQSGRPFFVMELVKGMPITQYCDEAALSTRERLALFGDVCSAINHAHQKGVIHRDIKPSNVMVTLNGDKPLVKVIDFGIAKATQGKLTDKTLFTRFEQFIGTPVYMSPEQASTSGLDIDTRSDIYALGVLLYELLVGKPPFDAKSLASAGYEEMRRIIREVEPVKPSSRISTMAGEERTTLARVRQIQPDKLHRLVEPDLDWIVMKAIEKDRSRRYETANGLAADIVRFLADEPVSATPPTAGYQFRKFARRNKVALRIAALLAAATAVSTWQAIRATIAGKKTADTLVQVAAERDAKDKARSDAEAITGFLTDVFQSPDPARGGRDIKVRDLLDLAARMLEADSAIEPARRVKVQAILSKTYWALGLPREAIPLLEKMRDYHLAASGPEAPDTLFAMQGLANAFEDIGRGSEALRLREEVLRLRLKVSGPEHQDTLLAMNNLAFSLFDIGRREEALRLREKLLPLSRRVNGGNHLSTLWAITNLANSYFDAGRREEALTLREEVLALLRKVPGHPDTLTAMNNLGNSLFEAGRREEAQNLWEEALERRRTGSGPAHPDTLMVMNNLANSYDTTGRRDEALKLYEDALKLRREVNGDDHPDTLMAMNNLAISCYAAGRRDEALKLREEALKRRRTIGPELPETIWAMNGLAGSLFAAGRVDEAFALQEEALALGHRVLRAKDHPYLAEATQQMAEIRRRTGRTAEAEAALNQPAAPKGESADIPPPPAPAPKNPSSKDAAPVPLGKDIKALEQELEAIRQSKDANPGDKISAMTALAAAYGADGSGHKAIKLGEEALDLARRLPGGEMPTKALIVILVPIYRTVDLDTKAAELERELQALPPSAAGPK